MHTQLRGGRRHATLLAVACAVVAAASTPSVTAPAMTAVAVNSPAPAATAPAPLPARKATFGIGPANSHGIDGRPYLTFLTAPGATLGDRVAVINFQRQPVTLNLYPVDTTVGSDGSFGYQARAEHALDAGSWLTLLTPGGRPQITIPARSTMVVPITIHVPSNASPGDHAAGVIASVLSQVTSKNGEKVDFEQRVALRAFFRVSGALHAALSVQGLNVRWSDNTNPLGTGYAVITYTVRNTGNLRLGARQHVDVSGLFTDSRPDRQLTDIPLLMPGTAVQESVRVNGIYPQIWMNANVVLSPLSVAGDVDPGLPRELATSGQFWAIPWVLLAIILGLVLIVVGWLLNRRRRRRRGPAPGSGRHRGGPRRPSDPTGTPTSVQGLHPVHSRS